MSIISGYSRYIVLIVSLLHLSVLMSTSIAFNATFVSIMNKKTSPLFNGTNDNDHDVNWASEELPISDRRHSYGFVEKSLTFAGIYFGSTCVTFIVSILLRKFGAHKIMFGIGVFSVLITAATPFLIVTSFPLFVLSRVLAGLSVSNLFPVAGIVCNEWGTVKEKGFFIAVLSAHVELACLFTIPLSGVIAKKLSWPSVFYIHAVICGFTTILWVLLYRDDPNQHPLVSNEEYTKIKVGKATIDRNSKTPVGPMLRTPSLWASWIATFGHIVACNFAVSFFGMYLTYGLHYNTVSAGLIPIMPLTAMLVIKFFCGVLSDKITFLSELSRTRLFNSIALFGAGTFFTIAGLIEPFNSVMDTIIIAVAVSLMGFCAGGYPKTIVLVAKQHTPFAMTILQITVFAALLFGSSVVPALTSDVTVKSWQNVFVMYGVIHLVTNTVYVLFTKAEPAVWTQARNSDSDLRKTVEKDVEQ